MKNSLKKLLFVVFPVLIASNEGIRVGIALSIS